jgi:ribosome maturation factor RimP
VIDRNKIEELIRERLEESEVFVVDIQVKPGNVIRVYLDEPEGISIDTCVEFSRIIESGLDRDTDDFELQVSSPGLTEPLKVPEQYIKHIGQSVKILTNDEKKYIGEILSADSNGFEINAEIKVKLAGSKKKTTEFQVVKLEYKEIKTTKVNLVF